MVGARAMLPLAAAGLLCALLLSPPAAAATEDAEESSSLHFSPEVFSVSSAFYVNSRMASRPGFECSLLKRKHQVPLISSSFGAGGGGERWQHSGLIVRLNSSEPVARLRGASTHQVVMRIQLSKAEMPFQEMPSKLYVGGLLDPIHSPSHWEVHGKSVCPPVLCLMPRPEAEVDRDVMVLSKPHCGWAPPLSTLALTAPLQNEPEPTLEVDVSHFLARNVTALKIWSVPTAVSEGGMWQTARLSLKSLSLHRTSAETLV